MEASTEKSRKPNILLIGGSTRVIDFDYIEISSIISSAEILKIYATGLLKNYMNSYDIIIITSYMFNGLNIDEHSTIEFTKAIANNLTHNTKLIFLSTDDVFSGENGLYKTNDRPNPSNEYGKIKLIQENILYDHNIIRFTTIGPSFSDRPLLSELITSKSEFTLYPYCFFAPISTYTLNAYLKKLINEKKECSLVHLASERISKAECILKMHRFYKANNNLTYFLSNQKKDISLTSSVISTKIDYEISLSIKKKSLEDKIANYVAISNNFI